MHRDLRNQWIWGFTDGAETWNGRLAMLAFITILFFEYTTSQSIVLILGF